jgi:hypothetical protein
MITLQKTSKFYLFALSVMSLVLFTQKAINLAPDKLF